MQMPLWSLTQERVEKLLRQIGDKEAEVDALLKLSKEDLWKRDLDEFIETWRFQLADEHKRQRTIVKGRRTSKKFKTQVPATKKRKGGDSDDSEYDMPKTKKTAAVSKQTKLPYIKPPSVMEAPKVKPPNPFKTLLKPRGGSDGAGDEPDVMDVMEVVDDADDDNDGFEVTTKQSDPISRPKAKKLEAGTGVEVKPRFKTALSTSTAKESTKPKVIKSGSDVEVAPKPAARQARAVAKKQIKYGLSSDSDTDNGDDLLGDVSNMVKGLPAMNGDSRSFFSTSASRPGSSAGYKAAPRAPSKVVDDFSADETDYTKLVPQQSPRRSILVTAKENQITDDEDDNDINIYPMSRPPPKATAAASARPPKAKAPAATAKPVKTTTKKEVAVSNRKNLQSPVAKAYAKRLAKKKIVDSEDDIDAMADDILDSPVVSDRSVEAASPPARGTAATRPARRAATTTKKTTYTFDDDDSEDVHSEEEPSAMYSESE